MSQKLQQRVHIISTGGTIEKTYDERDGSIANRRSIILDHINHALRLPSTNLRVHPIMHKDSMQMDQRDREVIVETISELLDLDEPIIVLHGTDTLEQTLEFCQREIPKPKRSVVFTGAMKPFGFAGSDALQNVTEALIAAKYLSAGIYLSFHGQVFAGHVRKDRTRMTFCNKDK